MTAFENQKARILKFYEATNVMVDHHKQTYGKLVSNLNKSTCMTQRLSNNLDAFMESSFLDFKAFRQKIETQPLIDTDTLFVFDLNKQEYVSNVSLPNKQIIVKQNFQCHLMTVFDNNDTPCMETFTTLPYVSRSKTDNTYSDLISAGIRYKKKALTGLAIWIDDYLNIYIPHLKTYLIYNYSKFPLYAFYMNMDKLTVYHGHAAANGTQDVLFNEQCATDVVAYNVVKHFMSDPSLNPADYFRSHDKRNMYKDAFRQYLCAFYAYETKVKFFSQYQYLAEKIALLSPPLLPLVVDDDKDETTIFAQSQRVRDLVGTNQKQLEEIAFLRRERDAPPDNKPLNPLPN